MWLCPRGRGGLPYRLRGGREQLEGGAGLAAAWPRSAPYGNRWEWVGGRRQARGWAGPSGPSPWAMFTSLPILFCFYLTVISFLCLFLLPFVFYKMCHLVHN